MSKTQTAKSPTIWKEVLLFAVAASLVSLSGRAPAQAPSPAPRAYAGEPAARIRGVTAHRLTPAVVADLIIARQDGAAAPAPTAIEVNQPTVS